MSLTRLVYLLCDECGNPSGFGDNAREARSLAIADGWEVNPGNVADLCPRCRELTP